MSIKKNIAHNIGDLEVWWIPQLGMKAEPYSVPVPDIQTAKLVIDTLGHYDLYQLENKIKPDYCNVGGLRRWRADDGKGNPGWEEWFDEESGEEDLDEYLHQLKGEHNAN